MSIVVVEKTCHLTLGRDPLGDVQVIDEPKDLVQQRAQDLSVVADRRDTKDELTMLVLRLHLIDSDVESGSHAVANLVSDAPLFLEGSALRQSEDHPQRGGLHTLAQVRATWTTW